MYDANQKRLIALEIARCGGILSKALDALRLNYEGFRHLSLNTLRKAMDKKDFRALVQKQEKIVEKGHAAGTLKAEKLKAATRALGKDDLKLTASELLTTLKEKFDETKDAKLAGLCLQYLEFLARMEGVKAADSSSLESGPEDDE